MALLKAFNPHELSAGIVLGVATGREDPLDRILSIVRDNLTAPTPQHVIVSAPRGYGKSFFLRYVQIKLDEIAKAENVPIAMALLPEELPHVKEPETLLAEIRRTFLGQPADTIGVSWVEDDGQAWDEQVARLDAAIEDRFDGRPGLLVAAVENFDLLLKKAFAKQVQATRLRQLLTRRGSRLMLIAASARGAFDRNYDRPLFKAFEEISFEPWSIEQSLEFFRLQRAAARKPALTELQEAKARAVATFIGGTPRLATLIGEALLEDDPLRAADLLEKLVDELTPYYKERIEVLPSRSQALLDALLRGGENCSATDLARRVGAPSQPAIAAALDELKKDLVVTGEKAPDSAEVLLRVTDRVFAHYYRKRILSHGLETCPLESLVDLLAVIYSPEEKKREADKFAAMGLAREAQVFERLWAADQGRSLEILTGSRSNQRPSKFHSLLAEWDRLTEEGRYSEGLAYIDRAIASARGANDTQAEAEGLGQRAWTLEMLGRFDEALMAASEAADKAKDGDNIHFQAWILNRVAIGQRHAKRMNDSLAAAQGALSKAEAAGDIEEQITSLLLSSATLFEMGSQEEALRTLFKAASLAEKNGELGKQSFALRFASHVLIQLGRNQEALEAASQSLAVAEGGNDVAEQVASLLQVSASLEGLSRVKEALESAHNAALMAESAGNGLFEVEALSRIAWLLSDLGRLEECLAFADKVAPKAEAVGALGEQADALLLTAICSNELRQRDKAILAIHKATEIAEKLSDLGLSLRTAAATLILRPVEGEPDLAYEAYEYIVKHGDPDDPGLYFDDIASVATKTMSWPRLTALLECHARVVEALADSTYELGEAGNVIANSVLLGQRDVGLKFARHFVSSLSIASAAKADHSRLLTFWSAVVDASAAKISSAVDDANSLSELACVFAAHSSISVRATALLTAAAAYHAAGRDPAALARLDPDLATTLKAVFPPKESETKAQRKPRKRRTVKKGKGWKQATSGG